MNVGKFLKKVLRGLERGVRRHRMDKFNFLIQKRTFFHYPYKIARNFIKKLLFFLKRERDREDESEKWRARGIRVAPKIFSESKKKKKTFGVFQIFFLQGYRHQII